MNEEVEDNWMQELLDRSAACREDSEETDSTFMPLLSNGENLTEEEPVHDWTWLQPPTERRMVHALSCSMIFHVFLFMAALLVSRSVGTSRTDEIPYMMVQLYPSVVEAGDMGGGRPGNGDESASAGEGQGSTGGAAQPACTSAGNFTSPRPPSETNQTEHASAPATPHPTHRKEPVTVVRKAREKLSRKPGAKLEKPVARTLRSSSGKKAESPRQEAFPDRESTSTVGENVSPGAGGSTLGIGSGGEGRDNSVGGGAPGEKTGVAGAGAGAGAGQGQPDHGPAVVKKIEPQYPVEARRRGISGHVVVRCLINTEGRVADVAVVKGDPPGVFDLNAMEAVSKWRFRPARLNGNIVSGWAMLCINFKLTP